MNNQIPQVAIVILYQNDKYLMQLRDNIPTIAAAGCWGFFGGHLEPGETAEIALVREVIEEIGYELPSFSKFGIYPDERVIRHVFQAPLLVELDQLVLNEGWDMGLLTPEDIYRGDCYSAIANEVRPLSNIHQKIMMDFINQK
ncbi:NUDIX hydrolase [Anabaena cylindrica FACHB-243]|uniref:NUDIX hydrolase n=1 Tax=Anabaena cylindrica (strain ATCC 27899 / PCC 7122) TaxID=272123 RepID=K9ZHH9_ANACC|nr:MULTISPECIES: NUDIX hydrolase [Anabaena]AFZ58651.1 NUDIX hydrolase [Anabaena cylindrica PCC 7122]MBD2419995.1 NUDIX hydrolase [Anabaena cylindrica FACHB-243]MBY5283034.1 NUDIX domain-containing protein [Anabaena sp. CCAP 1446/1C]MBY5306467.1 NUDIX domain-containing protein [Anabaena sp. CCAP 1446/1C]MCM2407111.1 NUDIX hydrolase [Anabaena sp. CCAP 1446/1C]